MCCEAPLRLCVNACAIQINPGTNDRLKQKCARENRLLAKGNKN